MTVFTRPPSEFDSPSLIYLLFHHPLSTLILFFHSLLIRLRGPPILPPANPSTRPPIRITTISDTHSKIPTSMPLNGDLLIHAGDLTNTGTLTTIQSSIDFLKTLQQPWPGSTSGYRYIIVIAGNHDSYFDPRSRSLHDKSQEKTRSLDWGKIIYLEHSSVKLPFPGDRFLKVYGAPHIPKCGPWKDFAFQHVRDHDAWSETVPKDVDVLVTHTPPKWYLDIPENGGLGDDHLREECWRVKPTVHVFGHIHSGAGKTPVWWDEATRLAEEIRRLAFRSFPEKQNEGMAALLGELLNYKLWVLGMRLMWEDVKGVLWNRVWRGQRNGSWMINAALTVGTTERLGNRVQTVVI